MVHLATASPVDNLSLEHKGSININMDIGHGYRHGYLEDAIDHRLDRLEDEAKEGKKQDKKNHFKIKALCKLAGVFNNPWYNMCQEGFDSTQIICLGDNCGGDGVGA
jgi:hypothetical protein